MGSNVEKMLGQMFEDSLKEIDKKMEKAFQNTMKRMEVALKNVMKGATVKNYYKGYQPRVYKRTGQLNKAISLKLEDTSFDGAFSFNVLPKYDESSMDHSEYDIVATYQPQKNKKPFGKVKTYNCHVKLKKKPNEEKIMEMTLGEGYHPKVGTANTTAPIWSYDDDGNDDGYLWECLEEYINKNLSKIFNKEYDKL